MRQGGIEPDPALREADVQLGQGKKIADVVKALGVSEVTYYRWRQEYGGMSASQVKRLKELERENARLRPGRARRAVRHARCAGAPPLRQRPGVRGHRRARLARPARGRDLLFIESGSPWENGCCESFNGKLRDELLNAEIFCSPR